MGTSTQQVERLEKGERSLRQEWIDRAAVAFGVSPADIITPMGVDELAQVLPDLPRIHSASIDDDMVEITAVDLSYSMGPGTTIDAYIEEEPVKFDIGFLRNITRSAFSRLRLARGVGDSMFPTLVPGDVVMIDTTQNKLNMQDRVYAISLHGAAAIKRLRMVGQGKVEVISDNPTVKDDIVDADDLAIHGRVIWFARAL